jgi:hypothetical protein
MMSAGFVALVTGCASATGREVVRGLVARRAAIVLVYLDDQAGTEALAEEVQGAGGVAVTVRAELADELDVERVFGETIAAFGRADVVVYVWSRSASAALLYRHAARWLARGGVVVSAGGGGPIDGEVARLLRARDITIAGATSGADALTVLDRWHTRTGR